MSTQEKTVYIEVYSILKLLGKHYISKLPKSLYIMIENNVKDVKNLKYNSLKDIHKNNIQKKSIAMIALFHINYWCDSEGEKCELKQIFIENLINNEKEKREKFNPDSIFKKDIKKEEKEVTDIIVYKKSLWKRIINKIKEKIFRH